MYAPQQFQDPDAPIRSTDNDAALARLSATQKRYLQDPFVRHLVPRALQPARPPLINIGTYVRTAAIDTLVDEWIDLAKQSGTKCQILSLGAGSDTRFWRIAAGPRKDEIAAYIEVDFPEIVLKKAMAIRKSKEMSSLLGNPEEIKIEGGGRALHSSQYHLLSADLRLRPVESLEPLFADSKHSANGAPLLSPSLPTLVLFECVLAYMSPAQSNDLLQYLVQYMSRGPGVLGCMVYEMFRLKDAFGRVMLVNLQSRNVTLPGVEPFQTLQDLERRFTDTGFTAARALTLQDIRKNYISESELERISKLEFLDETEELDLVLDHYAISWGLYLPSHDVQGQWGHWGLRQKQQ